MATVLPGPTAVSPSSLPKSSTYTFTSESVSEGHPDKVCDFIADSILDSYLEQDPTSRVACEVLCKEDTVVLGGEISSRGHVDHDAVVREAIHQIGYTDSGAAFNADGVKVLKLISRQSSDIAQGVDVDTNANHEQGAGDQGIMFGYACSETPGLMPLPIFLAHRLTRGLADDRRSGNYPWLRPDAKSQVSVLYEHNKPTAVTDVLVSTQHSADIERAEIADYVRGDLGPRVLGEWFQSKIQFIVNPTGSFVLGGPSADCGVTGRKIIADTYGGAARHGGGAFSGKDPSKVDRSAAYFCRYVARQIIKQGLAAAVEIQVAYAIGIAKPISLKVETFGTGDSREALEFAYRFDFRPSAIIERLGLLAPIYRQTTNYGHFGRPGLSWES
ncbi:methionine adenosyltransferase [Acidicapsa dinghuensis]|uniref:Methionine adenosyltransferase n=1 Tax=Acidicapsa dinghuensis TaxID=2218256 RepID=A0ABW1EEI6_9BACT|nr:methionine adenosyltransferase [Acidicapsa dinghuensis]